ncbi:MAG: ribosomal-protein-alanine N-acetyltransferase [Sphingobacteriales bacterium]|jgi:ribosomal-protein-alanine N-acetyltransferase
MREPFFIQTPRLGIRPTTVEDAKFILELLNSPLWKKNIGDRNLHTVEDAQEYIQNRFLAKQKHPALKNNTVILLESREPIGTCGIYSKEGLDSFDLGYGFLPQFHGKGLAKEAAQAVCQYAFSCWHLNKLSALTLPSNKPSSQLLLSLGFKNHGPFQFPQSDEILTLYSLDNPL